MARITFSLCNLKLLHEHCKINVSHMNLCKGTVNINLTEIQSYFLMSIDPMRLSQDSKIENTKENLAADLPRLVKTLINSYQMHRIFIPNHF